jgi:hypothetical protein
MLLVSHRVLGILGSMSLVHLIVGKLEKSCHGVTSWRQDKDERGTTVGVSECLGEVERRRLDVALPELGHHKVLHSRNHLQGHRLKL